MGTYELYSKHIYSGWTIQNKQRSVFQCYCTFIESEKSYDANVVYKSYITTLWYLFKICGIQYTQHIFVLQSISCTYDGVITMYQLENFQSNPQSICYIAKYLLFIKYLIMKHNPISYG